MAVTGLLIALLLPAVAGGAWLRLSSRPALLGYGYLLGILITILLIRLVDGTGISLSFGWIALPLLALTVVGVWFSGNIPWRSREGGLAGWRELPLWQKGLFGLLLVLILIRFAGFAAEILWRPLYPWDAWTTWAVKSTVWFELKQLVPFVDPATWLAADESRTYYTIDAWDYPPAVSLIPLWTALGFGQWNESVNNIPWLLCAAALGLGFYGQARLWGAGPLAALLFVYLLLSMPIVDAHIALAGYADLWMAAVYSLAAIAFFQWLRTRDRTQGVLALLLALACPLIKQEGAVWLLTFVPALALALIPAKKLLWLAGVLVLLLAVWFLAGGFSIELPGLGALTLTPEVIRVPYVGEFRLGFVANWEPFIQNLFVLSNWHLLWYLTPVVILIALPAIARDRVLLACSALIAAGWLMLFVLFFLTEASSWAIRYTSINRLFLQMVPVLLFYLLILVHAVGARRDTAASSVPQPA